MITMFTKTETGAAPKTRTTPVTEDHQVQLACWLCSEMLLTVDPAFADDSDPPVILAHGKGEVQSWKPIRSFSLFSGHSNGTAAGLRLSIFVLPAHFAKTSQLEVTQIDGGQSRFDLSKCLVDLKSLLRRHFAPLSPEERHKILDWLGSATSDHKTKPCAKLVENLVLIRNGLRHRVPQAVITAEKHRGLYIDSLFGLNDRSFYIRGWASAASGPIKRLTAISPEGIRVELAEKAFWHSRPDVDQFYQLPPERTKESKPGFLCYFDLPTPSACRQGWVLEVVDGDDEAIEISAPSVVTEISKAREALISDLAHERLPAQAFRCEHALPALTHVQERHHKSIELDWVRQYGEPPEQPTVSVLIPLYRRVDFLEHQMAQFADDPQLKGADLIYLLDSPELGESLRESAASLYDLYRVPFRLAALGTNGGFAEVNNLGATLARGRLLLLLNSDVLPKSAGWLRRMVDFFDSKPKMGALGVKLLFEDDTLQHAGLYFRRSQTSGLWENQHYYKGLDSGLPAANVTRMVPALCAACVMVQRERYVRMGGLRGVYVQGDYEDSDLCLRLREAGHEIWYLPEVELYHLEGQSYPSQDRARNLAWNRWLHSYFWDRQIEALMSREKRK